MRGTTHRAVGVAATVGVSSVVGLAPVSCAIAALAAVSASTLPDRLERPLGAVHRGWTHWLLTGLVVTAVVGGLVVGIGVGGAELLHARGYRWVPYVVVVAVFVMLGTLVGYWAHTVADACTPHGSPLLGPFRRADVHLLPVGWRIRTGGVMDGVVGALAVFCGVGCVVVGWR